MIFFLDLNGGDVDVVNQPGVINRKHLTYLFVSHVKIHP